jgi:hypothetical protein
LSPSFSSPDLASAEDNGMNESEDADSNVIHIRVISKRYSTCIHKAYYIVYSV